MYCQKCGQQNQDTATACVKCGTPMVVAAVGACSLYAGFWRRFAAYLIDYIIVVVMAVVIAGVIGFVYGAMGGTADGVGVLGLVVLLAVWWLYYALMESSQKQATLGKMALGIKVTDETGVRISFACATLRLFAKILSGLLLAIGYLMAAFTKKKQALHDIAAGCLVVNANATEAHVQAGTPAPVSGMPWWAIVLIVIGVAVFPLGILAAIAIPAYADYTVRARVAEAMMAGNAVKPAVTEFHERHKKLPDDLQQAGMAEPVSRHVKRVVIEPGTHAIRVVLAGSTLEDKSILHVPQVEGANIRWTCRSDDVPQRYLPPMCRDANRGTR